MKMNTNLFKLAVIMLFMAVPATCFAQLTVRSSGCVEIAKNDTTDSPKLAVGPVASALNQRVGVGSRLIGPTGNLKPLYGFSGLVESKQKSNACGVGVFGESKAQGRNKGLRWTGAHWQHKIWIFPIVSVYAGKVQ